MDELCFSSLMVCPLSAVQDLNESLAEFNIKGGVYDGVHGTVDVTKPGKSCVEFCWDVTICIHDVCDEEWQPAYNENTYKKGRETTKGVKLYCRCM